MLEKISEKTKQIIAESHVDGYGQDLDYCRKTINAKTLNYVTNLGRDLTNTNLINKSDENITLFDIKRRGFWDLLLMLDKESNILFTFMSDDSLDRLLKDKAREVPHYVDILAQNNEGLIAQQEQLFFPGCKSCNFEPDELQIKLLELCNNLILKNKDANFRHVIITNKKHGSTITSLHAYIFDADLNLVEDESWNKYLKPSYDSLEIHDPKDNEPEPIKPTLKSKYMSKVNEDALPKMIQNKTSYSEIVSGI